MHLVVISIDLGVSGSKVSMDQYVENCFFLFSTVNQLLFVTTLFHDFPVINWFAMFNFHNRHYLKHNRDIERLVRGEKYS